MPVRIRLSRVGTRNKPQYRVVAAHREKPRDGRFLENLGTFNPKNKEKKINLNRERYDYWLKLGAIPSRVIRETVKKEGA